MAMFLKNIIKITKLISAIIMVAVVLTACGTGKATVSADKETTGLTKAEIDTIQHDAARLAMESGEFVFMVSRIEHWGKGVQTTPRTNYLEVTDNKLFFQGDVFINKPALRTSGKIRETSFDDNSDCFKMSITVNSLVYCDFTDIVLTLYPGTNKAFGVFDGKIRMDIAGVIVPRRLANIARISWPSKAEIHDILD